MLWRKFLAAAGAPSRLRRGGGARQRRLRVERLEDRLALAADIATGLVHHWTFDETSGNVAVDAAGDADGTLVNWSASEPKWEPGRVGGALRFDTADNYVVAQPPAMSGSYSVSFWINVRDRTGINPRVFQSRAGNNIFVNIVDGRSVGFSSDNTNTYGPNLPTFNTWEHYAVKFNASTGQGVVFRSGVPVAIGPYVESTSLSSWFIGHSPDPANTSDTLKGAIDDLRVYSRLLKDEDIAALASMGSPEPVHQGPVHHWTFDETSGFTAHDASGGADGTLLNWNPTEPRWTTGKIGGAIQFSTSDNAIVTAPASLHAQWSVAYWVKLDSPTGLNPRIIGPQDGRELWAYIHTENNGGSAFLSHNTVTREAAATPLNSWEHYVITYDTSLDLGKIYHDGVLVASGAFHDNATAQPWVIGHNSDLGNHQGTLNGLLDDLRVYDRLLSTAEIQALANPNPLTAGLTHHWTFDETVGEIAADVVGGNDGLLQNFSPTQPKWVPGKIGGAIRFSEANDLLITEAAITQDQYTISFWLNQTGQGGFNPRIATTTDAIEEWIVIAQNVNLGVCMGACDPQLPRRGIWEHYALTFDEPSDRAEVYRNGALVATGTFLRASPLVPWVIGHHADLNKHVDTLDGMLDDMRVYDRLLNPGEIQALFVSVNPQPPTEGLIHHWTFDETIGTIAADVVGSNDAELRNYGPGQSTFVQGKIGGAISFTDGDDLVITETPITEDRYTFSFWLNQTGGGGFNPRLINPGDEDWFVLWEFADRGIHFSGSGVWDPRPATPNTWEHYAITLDQTTNRVEFYRSGVLVASGSYPDKPTPVKQWVMGHSGTLDWHVDTLEGMLDEMRVYDRVLSSSEIQIIAQFQPLVARGDQYSTREDVPLVVSTAIGVMQNDTTSSAGTRVVIDVLPARGQLTLNESGSFTYTPAKDFNGADRFSYHLESGAEVSATATVALSVTPVNDPPSFGTLTGELVVSDEQPQVFRLTNDRVPSLYYEAFLSNRQAGPATATDEAAQSLTWSANNDHPELFADQPTVNHRGELTFTPAPNAHGSAVVTVTVRDSGGTASGGVDTAVKTFVITVVKPHPMHNTGNALDPTDDAEIAPNDALEIISYINAFGAGPVPTSRPPGFSLYGPPYLDVTGDNFIAPDDVLAIINAINAGGPVARPSIPSSATFIEIDETTQGDWQTRYGAGGYAINSHVTSLPAYAEMSFTGGLVDLHDSITAYSTTEARGLIKPAGGDRIISSWSGDYGFTLRIDLTDSQTHRVALYMDEGPNNRHQKLEVLDAETGAVLDTRTLDDFAGGVYLVWNLRGSVKIRFTNLANGLNAVLSGVFFD